MRIKMGTSVQKMGTTVHLDADQAAYRKAIADTLRRELGPTHHAIKTVCTGPERVNGRPSTGCLANAGRAECI